MLPINNVLRLAETRPALPSCFILFFFFSLSLFLLDSLWFYCSSHHISISFFHLIQCHSKLYKYCRLVPEKADQNSELEGRRSGGREATLTFVRHLLKTSQSIAVATPQPLSDSWCSRERKHGSLHTRQHRDLWWLPSHDSQHCTLFPVSDAKVRCISEKGLLHFFNSNLSLCLLSVLQAEERGGDFFPDFSSTERW